MRDEEDAIIAHNKRVLWMRVLAFPAIAGVLMSAALFAWLAVTGSGAPGTVAVFIMPLAVIVAAALMAPAVTFRKGARRGAAGFQLSQTLLGLHRFRIWTLVFVLVALAVGQIFAPAPYGASVFAGLTAGTCFSLLLYVFRPPRGIDARGAIVDDEFARAMRSRAAMIGFVLAMVSLSILALLVASGARFVSVTASLLALPVAASAIYFVLLTRPGKADG